MFFDEYVQLLKKQLASTQKSGAERAAYALLSQRYHESNAAGFKSIVEMKAYVDARFPATFSVVDHILAHEIRCETSIHSLLDLGAGPGTATLAALNHFPIKQATLIEQTPEFAAGVKAVLSTLFPHVSCNVLTDSVHTKNFPKADLVVLSYLLTEMTKAQALAVFDVSLKATTCMNVVVLPGTPDAFELLLNLRDFAIKAGYFVLAPCPHVSACPMANVDGQWCHVRKRLHRSRIHMETKKATSGFEDEPYCYLVTSPLPAADDGYSRIINAPRHRPGHIYVDLCTPAGVVETSCVTKKNKGLFKEMKHAKWGDRELVLRQQ